MKRYIEFDDALDAPLEIMGWYLDATVKARIEQDANAYESHQPGMTSVSIEPIGEPEIDWIEIGPTNVFNHANTEHGWSCLELNQSTIPVSMREAFKKAVHEAVLERAKKIDDKKWKTVLEDE